MNLPVDQLLTVLAVVEQYKEIAKAMFPNKNQTERDALVRRLLYAI